MRFSGNSLYRLTSVFLIALLLITTASVPVQASAPTEISSAVAGAVSAEPVMAHLSEVARHSRCSQEPGKQQALDYAAEQLRNYGLDVHLDTFVSDNGLSFTNLIAEKPGVTKPKEIVFVSAHIDSAGTKAFPPECGSAAPGANDNGSGVAAMLEIARVAGAGDYERTVRFILFDGEEWGFRGSRHEAARMKAAGEQVASGINLDMIGYPADGKKLYFVHNGQSPSTMAVLSNAVGDFSQTVGFDAYHIGTDFPAQSDPNRLSDHLPFWQNGYNEVVCISEDVATSFGADPNYHSPEDTLLQRGDESRLDVDMVTAAARVSAAAMVELAAPYGNNLWPVANLSFYKQWERTEAPVALQLDSRTWFWGPAPFDTRREPYMSHQSGDRLVQYFDKGRIEENLRGGGWSTTAGLLVEELIWGTVRIGDNTYQPQEPSHLPVAGDPANNPYSPSYLDFLYASSIDPQLGIDLTGRPVTKQMLAGGSEVQLTTPPRDVRLVYHEPNLGHNIPAPFWEFMNRSGVVCEHGTIEEGRLMDWVRVLGFPITEPYWVKAMVGGVEKDVLVQLFERRVLTYTPSNPSGWQVEMGNVGRHYWEWRYGAK